MNTYTVEYVGRLRTSLRHDETATEIFTDAPRDNQGEGSSFSPTDLVAAAVGSCMFTIMGIRAAQSGIEIRHLRGQVKKVMGGPPRRIVGVEVRVSASIAPDSHQHRLLLEEAARNCPVILSLHPEIKKEIVFEWD